MAPQQSTFTSSSQLVENFPIIAELESATICVKLVRTDTLPRNTGRDYIGGYMNDGPPWPEVCRVSKDCYL